MASTCIGSRLSIRLIGKTIPGATDRQLRIAGFDQERFSRAHVLCIGAGGLISHVAPTLCRKGIGALTILDDDEVDASNLNRQRFYVDDIGKPKSIQLVRHLQRECIHTTRLTGYAMRLQEAIGRGIDLRSDVVVCGVDNNPTRMFASRHFRHQHIPVVFLAVSAQADHGYVFVQNVDGPCFGCLFPDAVDDDRYPCPGTPAMADIVQIVGGLAAYTIDTCLMARARSWNYRSVSLTEGQANVQRSELQRPGCSGCTVDWLVRWDQATGSGSSARTY